MRQYIARRVLLIIPTALLASVAMFTLMKLLPGDVATAILVQSDSGITRDQSDAQLAALSRKETAGFVWGDGGAVFEQQKKSKILMRLDQVTPKWISLNQYATEESIKKHADTIRKAQRGIFGAIKLMKANPKETAELISKRMGWTPEEIVFTGSGTSTSAVTAVVDAAPAAPANMVAASISGSAVAGRG